MKDNNVTLKIIYRVHISFLVDVSGVSWHYSKETTAGSSKPQFEILLEVFTKCHLEEIH